MLSPAAASSSTSTPTTGPLMPGIFTASTDAKIMNKFDLQSQLPPLPEGIVVETLDAAIIYSLSYVEFNPHLVFVEGDEATTARRSSLMNTIKNQQKVLQALVEVFLASPSTTGLRQNLDALQKECDSIITSLKTFSEVVGECCRRFILGSKYWCCRSPLVCMRKFLFSYCLPHIVYSEGSSIEETSVKGKLNQRDDPNQLSQVQSRDIEVIPNNDEFYEKPFYQELQNQDLALWREG